MVFLHKIVAGGADRSYGVHVAELAGLPKAVIERAREVLAAFEDGAPRAGGGNGAKAKASSSQQLALPAARPPILDELAELDVDAMTPLEALTKLFEMREKARGE